MTTAAAWQAGFIGECGDVQPTHDDWHTQGSISVRQLVGLADLGAQAGDRHQVEPVGKRLEIADILDLEVLALVWRRSHPREGQQSEAGQRRDRPAPFHEARQASFPGYQLGVAGAHAAHRDEADFHREQPSKDEIGKPRPRASRPG